MIIICPSCTARYRLAGESAAAPGAGRNVRCGRCGARWQATPAEPPSEIMLPGLPVAERTEDRQPAPKPKAPPGAAVVGDDDEAAGPGEGSSAGRSGSATHRSVATRRRAVGSKATRRTQAFLLGMLLALFAAGVHYRADVVRTVPASADLYALIGLPVNLRGLEFRNVETRRVVEEGLPVLIIEAAVVNLRPVAAAVPAVRIAVRGRHGEELYVWTVEPRQTSIEANGTMQVRSRLAIPPSGSQDVQLRFVERHIAAAGLR